MTGRGVWRFVTGRPGIAVLALALGVVVAGQFQGWLGRAALERRPIRVEPTKRAASWDVVKVPVDLVVPDPPAKDLKRLRREYARPDLVGAAERADLASPRPFPLPTPGSPGTVELAPRSTPSGGFLEGSIGGALVAGEFDLPSLPWGGTALAAVETDGRLSLTVRAKPRPFLAAPLKLRPYLEGARELAGDQGDLLLAGLELELARVGSIEARAYVAAGRIFGRDSVIGGARVYYGGD